MGDDFRYMLTPYDNAYETCERTYAELRIYTGEKPPAFVTDHLTIEPTATRTAGKVALSESGTMVVGIRNAWFLSSESMVASKDLRRHLDWLLDILITVAGPLREIQSVPEVQMAVTCVWWSAIGQGGPTLWPKQMKLLADLGLECTFDLYFVCETLE